MTRKTLTINGSIPKEVKDGLRRLDMMAAIDCTASMGGYLQEAKDKIQNLFHRVGQLEPLRPDLAVGVVGYRDHPPQDSSPVPYHLPLSDQIPVVKSALQKFQATGGGDHPESVWDGLHTAIAGTAWRPHSARVVVLVGDAPPHACGCPDDYFARGCPCGLNLEAIVSAAKVNGILMGHCAGAGNCLYMRRSFQEIAHRLDGVFVPLSAIDSLIARLEQLLRGAVKDMAADAKVLEEIYRNPTVPSDALAARLGKTRPELEASLGRLKTRKTLMLEP